MDFAEDFILDLWIVCRDFKRMRIASSGYSNETEKQHRVPFYLTNESARKRRNENQEEAEIL